MEDKDPKIICDVECTPDTDCIHPCFKKFIKLKTLRNVEEPPIQHVIHPSLKKFIKPKEEVLIMEPDYSAIEKHILESMNAMGRMRATMEDANIVLLKLTEAFKGGELKTFVVDSIPFINESAEISLKAFNDLKKYADPTNSDKGSDYRIKQANKWANKWDAKIKRKL
jgi:hypothetical protein